MYYWTKTRNEDGSSIKVNSETMEENHNCLKCARTYFSICEEGDCDIWIKEEKATN